MRAKQAMLTYLHKHNVSAEIIGKQLMSHDKEIKTMREAIEAVPEITRLAWIDHLEP